MLYLFIRQLSEHFWYSENVSMIHTLIQMDVCTREFPTMPDRPGRMDVSTPVNAWTCRLADTDAKTGILFKALNGYQHFR